MKKFFFIAAAALLLAACGQPREQILKVYNWSDYIDEEVIPEFEEWYYEQTGERVEVVYQTFDINETMLSKIKMGREDFDVVCPSDYIIEQMLQEDMLIPLELESQIPDSINYVKEYLSPYIRGMFDKIEGNGKNANDYAVSYMWGTTGILYNTAYVSEEEASSWDVIRNPRLKNRIFIKDSARDVYSQIILKVHEEELAALRESDPEAWMARMDELMNYTSDEDLQAVAAYMREVKKLVAGWEADFGKDQMVQEIGWVDLTWSGDAVWAIEEAAEANPKVELKWALPQEGFTVWFDGWVIPKYAKNIKAARYWIAFMNRPDIVIRNVDATGYVSSSAAPAVLDYFRLDGEEEEGDEEEDEEETPGQAGSDAAEEGDEGDEEDEEDEGDEEAEEAEDFDYIDVSYFFPEHLLKADPLTEDVDPTAVALDPVLYPPLEDIERSTMEHYWGPKTKDLIEMWSRVKGDNISPTTWVVIGLAAFVFLFLKVADASRKARRRRFYENRNKKD